MAAWFIPMGLGVAKMVAVAGVAYAVGRRRAAPQPDLREQALDDLDEGIKLSAGHEDRGLRADASGAARRVFRLHGIGAGVLLEGSLIARLRLKAIGNEPA